MLTFLMISWCRRICTKYYALLDKYIINALKFQSNESRIKKWIASRVSKIVTFHPQKPKPRATSRWIVEVLICSCWRVAVLQLFADGYSLAFCSSIGKAEAHSYEHSPFRAWWRTLAPTLQSTIQLFPFPSLLLMIARIILIYGLQHAHLIHQRRKSRKIINHACHSDRKIDRERTYTLYRQCADCARECSSAVLRHAAE